MMTNTVDAASSPRRRGLALLVAAAIVVELLTVRCFAPQVIWGDEDLYLRLAHDETTWSGRLARIVPGWMYFEWQQPFAYGVYGLLADRELVDFYHHRAAHGARLTELPGFHRFFRKLMLLNAALLLLVGINCYLLARHLKCGPGAALVAAGAVLFNPAVLFFIQATWPEALHAALLSSAFLMLARFDSTRKAPYLLGGGILFGFCALTKGVVEAYLWLLLPCLLVLFCRRHGTSLGRGVLLAGLLAAGYLAAVVPQMTSNYLRHQVFAVATNRWVNIECGIVSNPEVDDDFFGHYRAGSSDPVVREELSRARVLDYLRRAPAMGVIQRQLGQFVRRQLNTSYVKRGLAQKRWGRGVAPLWGALLRGAATALSWALFVGGLVGLWRGRFDSAAGAALALFALYYLASLLIVGFNPRFIVQLLPVLGILTAVAVSAIKGRGCAKRAAACL